MKSLYILFVLICFNVSLSAGDISYSKDCGPESLMYVLKQYNKEIALSEIKILTGYNSQHGTSMLGLKSAAEKLGLPVVAVNLTEKQLKAFNCPVLVFVDTNHYLVVNGRNWFGMGNKYRIYDPLTNQNELLISSLSKRWNGESLVFSGELKKLIEENEKTSLIQSQPGPYICFDDTLAFEGTIMAGEIAKHTFVFKNTGTDTLLLNGRTSCSCTLAKYTPIVPPGGQGIIDIDFNTTGKLGPSQQGMDIRTNDPRHPWVRFKLIVNVQDVAKVYPPSILFEKVRMNETARSIVNVLDSGDGTTEILEVITSRNIDARILPTMNVATMERIIPVEIIYTGSCVPKGIDENISIILTNGNELHIPIQGNVINYIEAYPPVASFGNMKKNTSVTKEIELLSSNAKDGITVDRMVTTSSNVSVSLNESQNSIRVTYFTSDDIKSEESDILFYSDKILDPILEIPVYVEVIND